MKSFFFDFLTGGASAIGSAGGTAFGTALGTAFGADVAIGFPLIRQKGGTTYFSSGHYQKKPVRRMR
jgi:hypothetical protein